MRKSRGFKMGRKFVKIFKWVIHRRPNQSSYQRLKNPNCTIKAMSKLCKWIHNLKIGAKKLCFSRPEPGYFRVGHDPAEAKTKVGVPKGQLAVYVGEREDDTRRVLVPVIYFNHPLFGDLLREAEKVYGFNHPGRIQIPCRISEFEKVQTRIAAADGGGDCRRRRIVVM